MSICEKIARRLFYLKLSLLTRVNRKKMLYIPEIFLQEALAAYNVDNWYLTRMYREWWMRWYVWEPLFWIKSKVKDTDAKIFECGCGVGLNLLWFAQNGYQSLCGSDLNVGAIQAGELLSKRLGYSLNLWEDDSISPQKKPEDVKVLLALNWTYYNYVDGFDLELFLKEYAGCLVPGGYFVIDVIDSAWNMVPNNQYLTSDWAKPESERSPSEYAKRYSVEEVMSAARGAKLHVVHSISHDSEIIPRIVYCLQREES